KSNVFLDMRLFLGKATPVQLQFLVWGFVLLLNFFTYVPGEGFGQAVAYAPLNTLFYAIIIYGNISCIFPRLYQRGKTGGYIIAAASGIIAIAFLRAWLSYIIYNRFFALKPEVFNWKEIFYFLASSLFIYLMSFVFRIALEYFRVKRQAEQMLEQKSLAELNLLKSQVQPHFLFNTLNNIYYEAYREAPVTSKLIERLSDIMRYFVDESPRDEVSLATEIHFLENYIALEKIRIRHAIDLEFLKDCNADIRIPPMLFMTFVENIFKHGIDKSSSKNKIQLSLTNRDGYLLFQSRNSIHDKPGNTEPNGFGIQNLRKRLALLYGDNLELKTENSDGFFLAFLKVPVT